MTNMTERTIEDITADPMMIEQMEAFESLASVATVTTTEGETPNPLPFVWAAVLRWLWADPQRLSDLLGAIRRERDRLLAIPEVAAQVNRSESESDTDDDTDYDTEEDTEAARAEE